MVSFGQLFFALRKPPETATRRDQARKKYSFSRCGPPDGLSLTYGTIGIAGWRYY
jgi:hypothetical protein